MRKLNATERSELVALYEAGASTLELARKFECHRQTVARQLKKAGVETRKQRIRTPDFDQHARAIYERGHSLDEIANMLGVQASTINRAVKAAGGTLRPQRRRPPTN
ncbi:helix-turn-helix domain-containing protein [Mycobacteroides abscessus]|uniref:helix-turn-helix domain-containing protein n=1 Tax=Mycobacteroides abscessus TaxID=36809 RepID=UPI000C265EAA|nr:helix-turn-helix domain-containing protein [Mycobacteroides abscessus]